jgi:hypothetical protein
MGKLKRKWGKNKGGDRARVPLEGDRNANTGKI